MGLASRQYMHEWGCTCPQCKEAYERDQQEREIEVRIASEKYRKNKEFGDNLRKMLGPSARCKHSRLLTDGEKWEDTFCNLLCVPCHLVKHGSCASEELIPTIADGNHNLKEERGNSGLDSNNLSKQGDKDTDFSDYSKIWADIKCPKCGSKTTLRTVINGKNEGKQFYVCIEYPKCNGRIHKK
jgi:ssDNA-binding Zn-finger/Zn-ribbon topoisomerase 1